MTAHKSLFFRVIAIALLFGGLFWVFDGAFSYYHFHRDLRFLLLEGPETLLDAILFKVPYRDLFTRVSFMVAALLGGLMAAVFLQRLKKSQLELSRSNEAARAMLNGTADQAMLLETDGTIVACNQVLLQDLGKPRQEVIGHDLFSFVPHHLAAARRAMIQQVVETGTPRQFSDESGGRKLENRIFPVFNAVGQTARIVYFAHDYTERWMAEKEKEKLKEQLSRSRKMEALGLLAGGVAHDLNNVLSGIVSYPELILLDLPRESPFRKPILTIQESGQKAAAIVEDLLALARRGVNKNEVVNLNPIVQEYLGSPEYQKLKLYHLDVEVTSDLQPDLKLIDGSSVHLKKTVMNLVSNAAEAQPDGGCVRISTENRLVENSIRGYDTIRPGEYVVLRVEDEGIGIAPEDMNRIFEPFYTKKVMGRSGTGLGMAVVWGTVQDHHGHINLRSAKGRGTTFELYFPVSREKLADKLRALPLQAYLGSNESILVVDDIPEQREIASSILRKLGYSVTTASSGEDALAQMQQRAVDLLVLDMIMEPGMDGLETYQKIIKLHPSQRAVIASGFAEDQRVKKAMALGATRYIRKPYTLEKIGLAVKAALET
jgi:PAS domain S-box-containing protein